MATRASDIRTSTSVIPRAAARTAPPRGRGRAVEAWGAAGHCIGRHSRRERRLQVGHLLDVGVLEVVADVVRRPVLAIVAGGGDVDLALGALDLVRRVP